MKRIATALILIPLVLLLVFKAPYIAVRVVVGIIALLALDEYLKIAKQYGYEPFRWLSLIAIAVMFLAPVELTGFLLTLPFFFLLAAMRRSPLRDGLPSSAISLFGVAYIGISLAALVRIRREFDGAFWLVVLFATIWAGDAVAMYVGKSMGRHKLAPRISPNKTWEGSVGSMIGSLAFSLLAFHYYSLIVHADKQAGLWDGRYPDPPKLLPFVLLVIVLNIAGQLGDLIESVIKRGADVKDSGTLLPGHGGILDRIDALLFAAPVLWYYLAIARNGFSLSY